MKRLALFLLIASPALAAELGFLEPHERVAPAVECLMHSDGWCYTRIRLPDRSLVLHAVRLDGAPRHWIRVIEGARVGAPSQ